MENESPKISPARFAFVFQRFQEAVAAYHDSPGPFTDFQSGLAGQWENYKAWLYLEARRLLGAATWSKKAIGSGTILQQTIDAIEVHRDKNHRNNIVEWVGRFGGEESKAHYAMLVARNSGTARRTAEEALFRMYATHAEPETCFAQLTSVFGGHYDLISYLFFIRDWNDFLPVRPTYFSKAFEMLGAPLKMRGRCSWGNYGQFLNRIRQVQELLLAYDIPNGIRFVDAHSFCWMLASPHIDVQLDSRPARILAIQPKTGLPPTATHRAQRSFTLSQLDRALAEQRRIGQLAQAIVLEAERALLVSKGRADLARQVRDVSDDLSLGYDIASFTVDGVEKLIEVKAAARRGDDLRFFLSENERRQSQTVASYVFALVLDADLPSASVREFPGNALPGDSLHSVAYEVRLRGDKEIAARTPGSQE